MTCRAPDTVSYLDFLGVGSASYGYSLSCPSVFRLDILVNAGIPRCPIVLGFMVYLPSQATSARKLRQVEAKDGHCTKTRLAVPITGGEQQHNGRVGAVGGTGGAIRGAHEAYIHNPREGDESDKVHGVINHNPSLSELASITSRARPR